MSDRPATRLVLFAAVAACSSPALVRDDLVRQRWREVRAGSVVLYTDDDPGVAVRRAVEADQVRLALAMLYQGLFAPTTPLPTTDVVAIHFRDCDDLAPILPQRAIALANTSADFEQTRLNLTCGDQRRYQRLVLVHELAHATTYHFLPDAPPWLEEGLSEYFETLEIDGDELVVGGVDPSQERSMVYLPPVDELMAFDNDAFRGHDHNLYPAAWRLVHTLLSDDRHRERFTRYATAVGDGGDQAEAWREAFGDLPVATLDRAYRDHFQGGEGAVWTATARLPGVTPVTRELSPGEVLDVWMQVLVSFAVPRQDVKVARQQIAIGERDLPDWPHAAYWRAVVADPETFADAATALDDAIEAHPDDRKLRLARVELLARRAAGLPATDALLDAAAADIAFLEPEAAGAPELYVVGRHRANRGDLARGLTYALRSLRANSSCVRCAELAAWIHHRRGQQAEAVRFQQWAIARVGDERPPPAMIERLRRYRAAPRGQ